MVDLHIERRGGADKGLASLGIGESTRRRLAELGDPDVNATIAPLGPGSTSPDTDDDPDRTSTYRVGASTSGGQRFQILPPHAKGGLGKVFAALDGELNREVALKQDREERADEPASRRRFVVEAEITGGLEHPGIVAVYGLGTYPDGRPFYAMRLIKGRTLREAIAAFHAGGKGDGVAFRDALRRFLDVCNAME
jgi:serine/threonine protein kinase